MHKNSPQKNPRAISQSSANIFRSFQGENVTESVGNKYFTAFLKDQPGQSELMNIEQHTSESEALDQSMEHKATADFKDIQPYLEKSDEESIKLF